LLAFFISAEFQEGSALGRRDDLRNVVVQPFEVTEAQLP